ncbi:MAG: DUF1573 domain-containing protein [Bacteroidales bacterium]|nr:DUF1573 domain-containing protein [Bacteroidales bacterium]
MRKNAILLISVFLFCSVTALSQNTSQPEDKVVSFDTKTHDFGDVLITDGPLSCKFVMTNISNNPIVIHNVVSSCGCTVPDYDKKPIEPGKSTAIEVTYSNDQGPYPFNKTITVYVSGVNRPVVLKIKGEVHDRPKSLEELYTVRMGPVAVRSNTVSMGYINQGRRKSEDSEIANMTNQPVKVAVSTDEAVTVSITPNPIPPRSSARVKYVVNTGVGPKNWGKTVYKVAFTTDGKRQEGGVTLNATINDDFDNMTKRQIDRAPVIKLDNTYNELKEVKSGSVVRKSFKVLNTGASDLSVYKVDVDGKNTKVLTRMPLTVKPGGSATVDYSFDASTGDGETIDVLTLTTNSVSKPQVNFFITANIVK